MSQKWRVALTLFGILLLSGGNTVFAEDTQTISENGVSQTVVTYAQQSDFTVTIPKKIPLGGDQDAIYTVEVSGDIYADQKVTVTPDATVTMADSHGKDSISATVSQEMTDFDSTSVSASNGVATNGSIKASGLSAGEWTGTLNFNIKLVSTGSSGDDSDVPATYSDWAGKDASDWNYVKVSLPEDQADRVVATADDNGDYVLLNGYTGAHAMTDDNIDQTKLFVPATLNIDGKEYKVIIYNISKENNISNKITLGNKQSGAYEEAARAVTEIKFDDKLDTVNSTGRAYTADGVDSFTGTATASACEGMTSLRKIDCGNLTTMGSSMLASCAALSDVTFRGVEDHRASCLYEFHGDTALADLNLLSPTTGELTTLTKDTWNDLIASDGFSRADLYNVGITDSPLYKSLTDVKDGFLYVADKCVFPSFYDYPAELNAPEGVCEIPNFIANSDPTSITLPSTLKILQAPFANNKSLTSMELPEGLLAIPDYFMNHAQNYAQELFTIPASLTAIGALKSQYTITGYTILGYKDSDVGYDYQYVPNKVATHMFYDMGTSSNAFKEFVVKDDNASFKADDGILTSKDGKVLYSIPAGKEFVNNKWEMPDTIEDLSELSFSRNMNIQTLQISDNLEYVGEDMSVFTRQHQSKYSAFLNHGNNIHVAEYVYSDVQRYEAKDDCRNYSSDSGCLYNKDGDTLVAVPMHYHGDLKIKDGTKKIAYDAFSVMYRIEDHQGCYDLDKDLTSVTIPASVTEIEDGQITVLNNHVKYHGLKITVDPANSHFCVLPDGTLSKADQFTDDFTGADAVGTKAEDWNYSLDTANTTITLSSPKITDGVTKLYIPYILTIDGVTYTSTSLPSFGSMPAHEQIRNVYIADGYTSLNGSTFNNCNQLQKLRLPTTLQTTYGWEMNGASGLITVNLADLTSLRSIGTCLFNNCSSLTGEIKLPESLTVISESAFNNCSKMTGELQISSATTAICGNAFANCSGLSGNLVLPDTLTSIGQNAFSGCSGFESITVPSSVTQVDADAFKGVTKIIYSGSLDASDWGCDNIVSE